MRKTFFLLATLCITSILLLKSSVSFASHIVGLDLFYTYVSGNTYKITLIAYGDCGSASSTSAFSTLPYASPRICVFDGNTLVGNLDLVIQAPSTGVEITPVCPADVNLTQCTDLSYTIPGIKKFVYSGNYTLPHTSAVWRFLYTGYMGSAAGAGRNATITNIGGGTITQLVDTLNNTIYHNSSPLLTVVPTPFFCLNNSDNYNPGAIDPDGDSLAFFLVSGMGTAGGGSSSCTPSGAVSYVWPYTPTNPLNATTFSFDSHTGQITFYPPALQRSLVVYNVEEHRGGSFVGTSQREMTFLVLTCTDNPPNGGFSGATNGTIVDSTHFQICENSGTFSVQINPFEAVTTNNITVTVAGVPTGATFTTTGNGTPNPHCTFSWNSTGVTPGTYTFFVTYTDNNCPLAGTQTIAYNITILPIPTVTAVINSPATCLVKAHVTVTPGGAGSPWIVKVSNSIGDTIQTFTGITGPFSDSLAPGTYSFTVYSTPSMCKTTVTITIASPITIIPWLSSTNPSYCGANDGTIKIHHLLPLTTDTIKYTYNGIVQPSLVLVVAADSSVTLTGLGVGVYTAITATYGNCVSLPAGPITLTAPPFTIRAINYTNPSFCGVCDGTITLYGLHPGQTDTITYTRGGVAQTPIVHFIGPDSQVVLTGLCVGTYANFIAKTAGVCISNAVGPVTLTAPPLTMSTINSTNPSYCGICDGTITLHGIHPGITDSIHYNFNGIAQPPVVVVVPSDSQVVLTGLCVGVYSNFVSHADGICVSNSLGPVTLTAPPFTIRALSSTNPDYCGICNGTITIYGVHPGSTDTVTFTKDGVTQTPIVQFIGTDSLFHLTGLCAGTYANIIVRTGGVCISNTLGPVTLTVPPFTIRALSSTNPDYCGICNGTITIYGVHPGSTDTVSFTKDGVPQATIAQFIGTDSLFHITGLCAGTYSNIIVRTGGICISNTLGPVTLTVPPFTMRAIGFTNPDYCGICNGTITLFGLHPGQLDTITYTLGGVAQPQIVQTIPADSQVVITGLCAGTYSDFVARTAGVCISNTLGPVTLTVPPFTIRALSFTNPTKCGFCDGIIKILGVHPGQLDTISYNFNGVPQTPISFLIGTDSTVTISGLCEGVFDNFVVKTAGVCVSNTLGPVTLVWPPIIDSFTFVPHLGCKGDTVFFTNHSWPASDLTYIWNFNDGSATSTQTDPIHIYTAPGTFHIRLDITNTRCFDSSFQYLTLTNLIVPGFNSNPDSFICQDSLVKFTNTSLGTQLTYLWEFGDGKTDTNKNQIHVYPVTGTYDVTLVVTNYVPCHDSITKKLIVDSTTAIGIMTTDSVICQGTSITFIGNYVKSGNIGVTWDIGNNYTIDNVDPITYSFGDPGFYTIIIKAYYRACPDTSAKRTIRVYAFPQIDLGPDTSICPGTDGIVLYDHINVGNSSATWEWNTGQKTYSIIAGASGTYYSTVTVSGCSTTDSVIVNNDCFINIPNVFTPNGDGTNDYFFPRQLLSKGLTTFKMEIYNRWGQLIFESNSTDGRGWDGTFNDVPQPEGVYVYIIDVEFTDRQKEHHQGNITLLR